MRREEKMKENYTDEEKIVSATWVHEMEFNQQEWTDIFTNFRLRFNKHPPSKNVLLQWESKLFASDMTRKRQGRPAFRLMIIPDVKASIEKDPHLSINERAKELGTNRATLKRILQNDLKVWYVPELDDNKRPVSNRGVWKPYIREDTDDSSSNEDIMSDYCAEVMSDSDLKTPPKKPKPSVVKEVTLNLGSGKVNEEESDSNATASENTATTLFKTNGSKRVSSRKTLKKNSSPLEFND